MRKLKIIRQTTKKNDGAVEDAIKVAAQVCKECNSALSQVLPMLAKSQEKDPRIPKKFGKQLIRFKLQKNIWFLLNRQLKMKLIKVCCKDSNRTKNIAKKIEANIEEFPKEFLFNLRKFINFCWKNDDAKVKEYFDNELSGTIKLFMK